MKVFIRQSANWQIFIFRLSRGIYNKPFEVWQHFIKFCRRVFSFLLFGKLYSNDFLSVGEFWNESECYDRLLTPPYIQRNVVLYKTIDEPSLTWPAATPIHWKERKFSPGSPKVQLSHDCLRDTKMSAVLFRDTKTWRTWRHVKKYDLYHWKSS